jgi:hydroxymethylpyrimidine pyrophosphatase-like HAD family hydrolase
MAFVYQDRDVVVRPLLSRSLQAMPEVRRVDTLTDGADPTPRCVLLFGDELNALVLETLLPAWRDDVRFLTSMTSQGFAILTLTSAEADKGLALQVACADLEIAVSEVVAMGDSETDIEMFKVAGGSVAMGQASDVVREAATWVTASHGADGVGLAIEALLDGRVVGQ